MIDLLLVDDRIAQLAEIAISRIGNAIRFQESLLELLRTFYIDLSDEFLSISSNLGKAHKEGRVRSHDIFSIIAACWIYEVKEGRTYTAQKLVERVTAREGLTAEHIVRARTEHLIERTHREWRHKYDKEQVELQVRNVMRLLTWGRASTQLKEGFRQTLYPGSWTTYKLGDRTIITHGDAGLGAEHVLEQTSKDH
ncbi:hypothetical protein EK21DRAFT_113100 [Setomelanomma holmii]|uniref:Uncharacterized protein n=1 Tax=Setomelanomma holmii TaxID=210430 RepID=A0A9P4LMS2_9PLEO|nr:hypothetical protein EK21DRAFT_113100 [Setomelanomma holmii]